MTSELDNLCDTHGVELTYISETGEQRHIDDRVKRALLDALDYAAQPELDTGPEEPRRCFIPRWLEGERAWGITVQLFGVRSERNQGIGDFEDAARLCEIFGPLGADFIGINPVHALFSADVGRTSPYFPSTRQFINPLYIGVDKVPHATNAICGDALAEVRASDHVDYAAVQRLKRRALEYAFSLPDDSSDFEEFCAYEEKSLEDFATFEALSEWQVERGFTAGWHGWPPAYQEVGSEPVASFRREQGARVRFHKWLQWVASRQLAEVQQRARAAGMRIGLYLDLAVGVAPDGAATWSEPASYARGTRIGAPPDFFNSKGQDWGLVPLKPSAVQRTDRGFAKDLAAAMRFAGAVRLDHVMGLKRLYWIPSGSEASDGGYVRYPLRSTLDALACQSQTARAIVIGEDLGTVPPGFRDTLSASNIFGYRVLYFERTESSFGPPEAYTEKALACVSTHDLSPFAGWWLAKDIETRERLGLLDAAEAAAARDDRAQDRERLIAALREKGSIDRSEVSASSEAHAEAALDDVVVAVHAFLSNTPSRLIALQLEDLSRATDQVNLPGTVHEHRNWSLKLKKTVEELGADPFVLRSVAAVARARPRPAR